MRFSNAILRAQNGREVPPLHVLSNDPADRAEHGTHAMRALRKGCHILYLISRILISHALLPCWTHITAPRGGRQKTSGNRTGYRKLYDLELSVCVTGAEGFSFYRRARRAFFSLASWISVSSHTTNRTMARTRMAKMRATITVRMYMNFGLPRDSMALFM